MIVILGSKPNPILPSSFDDVIYVNGSIYYKGKIALKYKRDYHIITNLGLTDEHEVFSITRDQIRSQSVGKLIEIQTAKPESLAYSLQDLNYKYLEKENLTRLDREAITNQIVADGFYLELIKSEFSAVEKLRKIKNCLKPNGHKHVSMGVFALIYAIHNQIGNPPYVLCGIGLENDGYSFYSKPAERGHLMADVAALRVIAASKYAAEIKTTDQTLACRTGIKLLQVSKK